MTTQQKARLAAIDRVLLAAAQKSILLPEVRRASNPAQLRKTFLSAATRSAKVLATAWALDDHAAFIRYVQERAERYVAKAEVISASS